MPDIDKCIKRHEMHMKIDPEGTTQILNLENFLDRLRTTQLIQESSRVFDDDFLADKHGLCRLGGESDEALRKRVVAKRKDEERKIFLETFQMWKEINKDYLDRVF